MERRRRGKRRGESRDFREDDPYTPEPEKHKYRNHVTCISPHGVNPEFGEIQSQVDDFFDQPRLVAP